MPQRTLSQTHAAAIAAIVVSLACAATLLPRPDTAEAARYRSYSSYLSDARPILHQWWQGNEAWYGAHFMLEPTSSNTENAAELQQILNQWWGGLEAHHGSHFLLEPTADATDSTPELHQLLNQWQNAIEGWRGSHFMLEPPNPFQTLVVTSVGRFDLSPRRTAIAPRKRLQYDVGWTVPRPKNWHDLDTIDLRVCGKGGLLWLRWSELRNTLSLLNPRTGRKLAKGNIGADRVLKSRDATLRLAHSSTSASGPTSRSMTLELNLAFRSSARGSDCGVELAATDDLGNRDRFKPAGRLKVRG